MACLRNLRLLCLVLICTTPTLLFSQSQTSDQEKLERLQKQLDDMQAQMAMVQAQIRELSEKPAAPALTEVSTAGRQAKGESDVAKELNQGQKHEVGKADADHVTYSQDQMASPRIDNAPLDPKYPGYFRIPGTDTFLRIGGYFKTDFIRDIRQAGDPERFIPSTIPVPNLGLTNSTVSVRPTRLSLDFLIPTEALGKVRFYVEGDLFGSNATTPRMRHAYAQAKNLLIGQTFSNFMDPDSGPDQLDFQGPNGQVLIRSPQLRYSIPVADKTSIRISIEKASSDVSFSTPEFKALPNNPSPDGTVTLRHEMDRGHVQLGWLFRGVAANLPNGVADSVFGWGFNLTGLQKTIGRDNFVYQLAYGRGIERYLNDTSGLGIDAAPISNDRPELRALPVLGAYGAYQHYWVPKVRSSLIYGFAQVDNTPFEPGSTFHQSNYSAANIIWNVAGSLHVGTEFLYGWVVKKDGSSGNAPRLMLSVKYNFVKNADTAKK